jgi:hypothetical protein
MVWVREVGLEFEVWCHKPFSSTSSMAASIGSHSRPEPLLGFAQYESSTESLTRLVDSIWCVDRVPSYLSASSCFLSLFLSRASWIIIMDCILASCGTGTSSLCSVIPEGETLVDEVVVVIVFVVVVHVLSISPECCW